MNKRTALLAGLFLSAAMCFAVGEGISVTASAEESFGTSWVVSGTGAEATDVSEGGVGTFTFCANESSVQIPVSDHDLADGYLSIKYDADFKFGERTYLRVYMEDETYKDVCTNIATAWNVKINSETFDGYKYSTIDIATVFDGGAITSTVSFVRFKFYDLADVEEKNFILLGMDFHTKDETPTFVTDVKQPTISLPDFGEADSGIVIGDWTGDSAGNMQYSKDENGTTTIYFPSEPTDKSRIKASVTGHDVSVLPKLKMTVSANKSFTLYLAVNGTSTDDQLSGYYETMSEGDYSVIYDVDNYTTNAPVTATSIVLSIDRLGYYDSATYADETGKTIKLDFEFVDANGNPPAKEGVEVDGTAMVECPVENWDLSLANTVSVKVEPFAGMNLQAKVGDTVVYEETFETEEVKTLAINLSAYSAVEKVSFVVAGSGTVNFKDIALSLTEEEETPAWQTAFDAVAEDMYMTAGASIRLVENSNGIRFETNVSVAQANALAALADEGICEVKYGTLLIPVDYFTEGATPASLRAEGKVLDVPSTGFYTNASTAETYKYWGSIVNLRDYNYTRNFIGIGYVEIVTTDGETNCAYASYDLENARSMYQVAKAAYAEKDRFSETQVALLKVYLDSVVVINADGSYAGAVEDYTPAYVATMEDGKCTITSTATIKTVVYNDQTVKSTNLTFDENKQSVSFEIA